MPITHIQLDEDPEKRAQQLLELMELPRRRRRELQRLNPGMRIPGANVPVISKKKRRR